MLNFSPPLGYGIGKKQQLVSLRLGDNLRRCVSAKKRFGCEFLRLVHRLQRERERKFVVGVKSGRKRAAAFPWGRCQPTGRPSTHRHSPPNDWLSERERDVSLCRAEKTFSPARYTERERWAILFMYKCISRERSLGRAREQVLVAFLLHFWSALMNKIILWLAERRRESGDLPRGKWPAKNRRRRVSAHTNLGMRLLGASAHKNWSTHFMVVHLNNATLSGGKFEKKTSSSKFSKKSDAIFYY